MAKSEKAVVSPEKIYITMKNVDYVSVGSGASCSH